MEVDYIGCPAWGHRIREFEPDICLKKLDGRAMFFYHVRCEEAAQRFVSESVPETWNLTHRHLFWDDAS